MIPFYRWAPERLVERAFYAFFPLWKTWLARQRFPAYNVVQAIIGYGTETFDHAETVGALKVLDCPNSHPATFRAIWQRECGRWCPGEKLPIPEWMFARMTCELERADLVIVQSEFCKESMLLNGIPADKVMVHPLGANTAIFSKRPSIPKQITFVCVGTICLRKGHQYLFRAWEIVKCELPGAELVCIGDYKSDFRIERPKWEGQFIHRHSLAHAEVARVLQNATAFVFPSQEEGIARAQIEALACGLPVIGTHEAGTSTVVEDGVEGFVVNGRDPQAIAAAMIRLGTDRALNERMGAAAFSRMGQGHTWQDYGDRLLARYSEALKL